MHVHPMHVDIDAPSEAQLIDLNRRVVERLQFLNQARASKHAQIQWRRFGRLWHTRRALDQRRSRPLSAVHRSTQAERGELENRLDLFVRDVELLHHFLNTHAILKILKHGCHRHACTAEHPSAADFARDTFNGWALRPI